MHDTGLVASVVAGAVAGEGLCELEGVVGGAVCEYVNGHIVVGNHVGKEIDNRRMCSSSSSSSVRLNKGTSSIHV